MRVSMGTLLFRHQLRAGQLQDRAVPEAATPVPPGLCVSTLPQWQGQTAGPPEVPVQVGPGASRYGGMWADVSWAPGDTSLAPGPHRAPV